MSAPLNNGKVLVAGGEDQNGNTFASAELYDPVARSWSALPPMSIQRARPTATVLPDGDVLVAAGYVSPGVTTATAELFHPASNSWSTTGSMAVPRLDASAVLLPNGTVLVAGGYDSPAIADCEIYDPSTGTWSGTGALNVPREQAMTAVLGNGSVLLAGGKTGWETGSPATLATAEIYNPNSRTWSYTGSMSQDRYGAAAASLPNGNVLVAGGATTTSGSFLSSAEVFDTSTATWSAAAAMSSPRLFPATVALPDGSVFVGGGQSGSGAITSSTEIYHPATNAWSSAGSLPESTMWAAAQLVQSNFVLVAGGETVSSNVATATSRSQLYGPLGVSTASISGGSLGFVNAPVPPAFAPVTLNGTNQSTTGAMPIDVGDATGSGQGWRITATSTLFSSGNHSLSSSSTTVSSLPGVVCDATATCTTAVDSDNLSGSVFAYTLPAGSTAPTATPLFNAQSGSGMGDQTVSPTFSLAIPANTYAGAYTSTWTISVVSGP